jgi:hypothetical protein
LTLRPTASSPLGHPLPKSQAHRGQSVAPALSVEASFRKGNPKKKENNMLLTILFLLATVAAIVGAIAGIIYPFTCKALEKHLDSTVPKNAEDEQGNTAWYKKRWALDKTRTRTALSVLGAYAVGMFSLIPVQSMLKTAGSSSNAPIFVMLVLTAALLTVGLRSTIHNDRDFKRDMKRSFPDGI